MVLKLARHSGAGLTITVTELSNLYHFNSVDHTNHDIHIMPIEEVVLDNVTSASKLLDREDFWMRELCSVYPYDNVREIFLNL